jgi:hypothetical protein
LLIFRRKSSFKPVPLRVNKRPLEKTVMSHFGEFFVTKRRSVLDFFKNFPKQRSSQKMPRSEVINDVAEAAPVQPVYRKTIQECVVDAVRSSILFAREQIRNTGNGPARFTKAYSAEEPYCIVRVFGFKRQMDENDKYVAGRYVVYNVNGGSRCKMTLQKYKSLCAEFFPEDNEDSFVQDDYSEYSSDNHGEDGSEDSE